MKFDTRLPRTEGCIEDVFSRRKPEAVLIHMDIVGEAAAVPDVHKCACSSKHGATRRYTIRPGVRGDRPPRAAIVPT